MGCPVGTPVGAAESVVVGDRDGAAVWMVGDAVGLAVVGGAPPSRHTATAWDTLRDCKEPKPPPDALSWWAKEAGLEMRLDILASICDAIMDATSQ